MKLTEQQKQAFDKFKRLKVGALFMQQGTGKTRVAIELANSINSQFIVFIVPHALKQNVKNEINKWGLTSEYMIETYQGISMSDVRYINLLNIIQEHKQVMIIADESIFIKNDQSKRFNRLLKLAKYSEYRLILNGTPLTKNEWDIYNQMEFLSPKIIGMGRSEFLNTFFKKIRYKKRGHSSREFYKLSDVNMDYLYKLIEPYIFQSELEFSKQEKAKEIIINSSEQTIDAYDKAKKQLLKALSIGECEVEMFTNLANICFSDKDRHKHIAQHLNGQIIVFCTLLEEVKTIAREIDCYVITGAVTNRDEVIEQFKNDNKPLLITFGTGAFGLNLQFCNRMAFASLTFDYAKVDQAKARIKRIGQNNDIEYTYFTSHLGIFKMIKENIRRKMTLKELIVKKIEEDTIDECI